MTASLLARFAEVVIGDPADPAVTMGPLATAAQLTDALDGVAELLATTQLVAGSGARVDGRGTPAGKGYFVAPTLLRSEHPVEKTPVHWREVFGPVATLLPYSGGSDEAAASSRSPTARWSPRPTATTRRGSATCSPAPALDRPVLRRLERFRGLRLRRGAARFDSGRGRTAHRSDTDCASSPGRSRRASA